MDNQSSSSKLYQYLNAKNVLRLVLISALSVLLGACQIQPLDVYSSADKYVNFAEYETFSVNSAIVSDQQFLNVVTSKMETVLAEKGYRKSSQADLVVRYQIDVDHGEQVKQEHIPIHGNIYTRSRLEAVYRAKILVNVIDTNTHKVVWKAASSRDLLGVDTSKINSERVYQRIQELLESFPSR